MERLKRRQDFVAASKAMSLAMPTVVVQKRARADGKPARIGFTCTKKLGNAVARNYIKRRLREAARLSLPEIIQQECDYVLIGRVKTALKPFSALQSDLIAAVHKLQDQTKKDDHATR